VHSRLHMKNERGGEFQLIVWLIWLSQRRELGSYLSHHHHPGSLDGCVIEEQDM
jgi:hypothetical protein